MVNLIHPRQTSCKFNRDFWEEHMKSVRSTALGLTLVVAGAQCALAGELTIATVNNGHMIEMQKLTPAFEAANPGISVNCGECRSRFAQLIQHDSRPVKVVTAGVAIDRHDGFQTCL